jgi:hypothetical protein
MNFFNSGVNKVTLFKAAAHGLARGTISAVRGGSFKAGFMSGFSSGLDIGTKAFGDGIGGFVGRTTVMGIIGGTASALGGGKFANGAMSGAFVHMFNAEMRTYPSRDKFLYVKDRIDLNKDALLAGAQDGHLTLDEAIAWYRYGNGETLTVDGNLLSTSCIGSHCFVTGSDYWVHGQVTINPENGHIYDQYYDFEMHGTGNFDDGWFGLRDYATQMGHMYISNGQKFEIQYRY